MSSPITLVEFASALARSVPSSRWSRMAVANSGGPDSTCLLYLLHSLVQSLVSFHVDHSLQSASPQMAACAATNSERLGVDHRLLQIHWGVHPFPPKPTSGPLEQLARDARYHVLFDAMSRTGISIIAFAHHADDQVETCLMRLARGSTTLGAAGMRPYRRWGMGATNSPSALGWVGHQGLDRFIIRPLLDFPKDRILATCDLHGLDYVTDPTNFQPDLTIRNAIRQMVRHGSAEDLSIPLNPSIPRGKIKEAASSLLSTATYIPDLRERLRYAVKNLATTVEHVDQQGMSLAPGLFYALTPPTVTLHLRECVLPSPIGTLLLSASKLQDISNPLVRFAAILRVVRYVSFHPWGSLRADGNRRQNSIHRIITSLWNPHPQAAKIKTFTAGGGVLWTPAIFHADERLRVGNQCLDLPLQDGDSFCWLASRLPPFSKNPQEGTGSSFNLVIDLTEQLKAAMNSGVPPGPLEVLYDCRFLLRIDPTKMPTHVKSALARESGKVSIKILPSTPYYWPKVVLQRELHPDEVLALLPETDNVEMRSPWISMEWVRLLDAT